MCLNHLTYTMLTQKRNAAIVAISCVIGVATALFFYFEKAEAPAIVTDVPGAETINQETKETATTTDNNQTTTPTETKGVEPTTPKTTSATSKPVAKPAPAPTSKVVYSAVVSYTDKGFKPFRVTIEPGQTVRFLNQSSREMWVASNIHPTHSNYLIKGSNDCLGSSFDQCKAVGKGEYWDFKFDPVGSWDFHNHMRPTDDGTIYVVKPR